MPEPILVARHGTTECHLLPALANRHGLITGATGTGKTITLQTLAEGFSRIGVPVFMADVKGDLTGISQTGRVSDKLARVLAERGIEAPAPRACPTTLWDVFGEQGHPVRATISDMGPLLLSRMLALNETQAGVMNLVFKIADDHGLALLDLKDLRAMLQHVGENAKDFTTEYGNISAASVGAIQRGLLQIEQQGGDRFFGEPMLDIADFMQTVEGHGVVNILAADRLMTAPRLYATFLLWMLSELFETLPEVGDLGGCTSSRRTRWTSRTACWASWATVCSTRCAPSPRATRRRCSRPPAPCVPTPGWTSPPPSPNWVWARRW